jgi:hypothetical protein
MMYRKKQTIFLLLILISTGCNSWRIETPVMLTPTNEISRTWVVASATQPYPSKSPTPRPLVSTPTHTPTEFPTATITPTWDDPLIVKTLRPDQEQKMFAWLQLEDCELPCYLGITPGETEWTKAQTILNVIGGRPWPSITQENGWPIIRYSLDVGYSHDLKITPEVYQRGIYWLVSHSVVFTVGKNRVERIQVSLSTPEYGEIYRKNWGRRYSLEAVLRHLGEPDAVYFNSTYDWYIYYTTTLIYKDVSAIIEYGGLQKDYDSDSICPLAAIEDGRTVYQSMVLTNPDSPLSMFPPGKTPLVELPERYRPIEALLEISAGEFTRRLLADSSTCFELKEVLDQ